LRPLPLLLPRRSPGTPPGPFAGLRRPAQGRARVHDWYECLRVLGNQGVRRARVLDLGFGGVAMELDSLEDLPENLLAVLHVPILPPVRVKPEAV